EGGGEAMVCEARLVDGLTDAQVEALFNSARDEDYAEIAKEARELIAAIEANSTAEKRAEVRSQLGRIRKRVTELVTIDFFGPTGRLAVEGLLGELERHVAEDQSMTEGSSKAGESMADLMGRTWVTRRDVHVDRIACSWLIRRFIDSDAVIRFVPGKGY